MITQMQARIRLFSKRHERAIYDRRLSVSLPRRLRRRLWHILEQYNERFEVVDHTNWHSTSSTLEELESELKGRYGVETLVGLNDQDERVAVDLQGFVLGAYPSQVFDVIELFYVRLSESLRLDFQGSTNLALDEEGSSWRLADGQFFQVSSDFVAVQVVARSYELLKAEGFEGALDEFNEARNDLESGDYKGAILNSCKSFESVVKSILGETAGNASVLNRQLMGGPFGVGLPDGFAIPFAEQVLNSLRFSATGSAGMVKAKLGLRFLNSTVNLPFTWQAPLSSLQSRAIRNSSRRKHLRHLRSLRTMMRRFRSDGELPPNYGLQWDIWARASAR